MVFAFIMYLLGLEIRYREGMKVNKNSFQAFLFAARPNTLTAAIAPVLAGATFAAMDIHPIPDVSFSWIPYFICLGFAVGMQITANLVNDLYDFLKGSDGSKRMGPPRACAMGWVDVPVMKKWIAIVLSLSILIGIPAIFYGGFILVAAGVACVLFAFLYSTFFSYHGMGDILVLLFFGLVPLCFTYYLESGTVTWQVVVISLGMGIVVDMLLVLNNFRDIDTDRESGKITMAVRVGKKVTLWSYFSMGIIGYLSTWVLLTQGVWFPSAMASPFLLFHLLAFYKMKKIGSGPRLNEVLASTSTNIFIFGFLLSAGFLVQISGIFNL